MMILRVIRGGSRTAATSKIERFVIIVNDFQLPAVNYYHKVLHLGCCSNPRSASGNYGDKTNIKNFSCCHWIFNSMLVHKKILSTLDVAFGSVL